MATPSLVDPYGRPMIRSRPVYGAAGSGRRFSGLVSSGLGGTQAVLANATMLRNRSRDLLRNNPWAWNAIESFVANCVGTGIQPLSQATDERFREDIQALWNDWADEADASQVTDFFGLQSLAARGMAESGECFVRLRIRRLADGLAVPLQVQVLEPDHVPLTRFETMPNGNTVHAGIEFTPLGQRAAYWMTRQHPGERTTRANGLDEVRVPADLVTHVYKLQRPGQIRGEPWLARVIIRLAEIDQYDDAELVRKKTMALFTAFVTSNSEQPAIFGETVPDATGDSTATMEPGTTVYLEPGEDVRFAEPTDVGRNYQDFVRYQLRGIAAGIGVTYEQLTGDLSDVNFSSIRAGLIEFRRRCEALMHQVLVWQFCRPIWQRFVTEAVLSGAIRAPGFERNRRDFLRVRWLGQGWEYVDPEKEVNALVKGIKAGITSRSDAIAQTGEDPEMVDETIARERRRAEQLSLVFSSDAAHDVST